VTITVDHRLPRADLALGLVRAEGVAVGLAPDALAAELDRWIERRRNLELSAEEEALRVGGRDILRNGRYRPTGRGKPASEYLMRAAAEQSFPRINGPVDACNLVSLQHCVAISLWDLELAATDRFEFRLGGADESYVFNTTGQVLELADLVCGCAAVAGMPEAAPARPIVTPIKDSMATKLRDGSTRLAGAIYYPLGAGSTDHLRRVSEELLRWLLLCGAHAAGACELALPGQSATL
jgi:DNA/RNA-binding domain of Phe-tRNA-synthetase-like protein